MLKNPLINAEDMGSTPGVREDPLYPKAAKPVGHSYGACVLEPGSRSY